MTVSLASLLVQQTQQQIYDFALGLATSIGLPTTSWQAGDPTRSLYNLESETLSTLENVVVGYIQSGFLDFATGQWLIILADQVYNIQVPPATFATTQVVLTNNGGGQYLGINPGDITVKSTISGMTFRNTTGGSLPSGPGTTLTLTVVADMAGSASSAGAGEIDYMVTTMNGVTVTNPLAAVGTDQQADSVTRQQCRDKLGSFSPNGPKEAYRFVATTPSLTGTSGIIDARVYGNTTNGAVTVYLRGPSGAISAADLALAQTALLKYATPLCITPTIVSCNAVPVPVTYSIWVYKKSNLTAVAVQTAVTQALAQMLAAQPIGGDVITAGTNGSLYVTQIESTIKAAVPQAFRVQVTAPTTDLTLNPGDVAVLSTVTATVNIVTDP